MNLRFESKEKFEVFGVERVFKLNAPKSAVPKFWSEIQHNGVYDRLYDDAPVWDAGGALCRVNAVKGYRDTGKNTYPYMIAAKRDERSDPAGYLIVQIPAATWAVFRGETADTPAESFGKLYKEAFGEWLPSSGYDVASDVTMELYFKNADGKYYEEVWIPVKKQKN